MEEFDTHNGMQGWNAGIQSPRVSPVARLSQQFSDRLETFLIFLIESFYICAVDVDDTYNLLRSHQWSDHGIISSSKRTYLPRTTKRHHDLASTVAITGNVAGELLDIFDQDSPTLALCCSTTYTLPNSDCLAGDLPHERSENQLLL
ncbi:hypothetical protein LTS07_000966 [Exophiala sideris]|uniref:Uncharacterized protein n=1 Tax=Exophiala sideris TaxID=1016849 RepID=A0ABR0JSB7_9EURO|nr:hypothetical protein LTS07_000966 [Exophiala sideris]KAK5068846.1 hypothetical protein LTR69_000967 [Exophiala sideris]KAK5186442.1 hypothetical protein LTR44_001498 [Eurotiomycetes sp. CCFEE 6388]